MRLRPGINQSQNHAENSSAQVDSASPNVEQPIAAPNNGHESGAPSVDPEEVEELAFLGLEVAAIALLVECNAARLSREFATRLARGRARQQQFLLEKLVDRIEANELSALRLALKNFCGMSDNPEQAALQRHKLAQLRAQEAAGGLGSDDQVLSSAEPLRLVQSGKTTEQAAPNATAPEPAKPPASVRPRYSSPTKLGGEHASTGSDR